MGLFLELGMSEAVLPRPRKRIGFMRRKRVLGYYVRVDEHGCEGEGADRSEQ